MAKPNFIKTKNSIPEIIAETQWLIFKQSRIHGIGGFAKADIPKGTHVIEYLGETIDKKESLRRCEQNNQYIFTLNKEQDLDGNVDWNPARLLNHSCDPNCEAELSGDHIWIAALQDIRAGEELTFNYGFDLEDYKRYPCYCGAPNCVGYIVAEEFFDHVRKQNAAAIDSGRSGIRFPAAHTSTSRFS